MDLLRKYILWAIVSVFFSFPIGGAIGSLAQNSLSRILENPLEDMFVAILGAFMTTMNGGFVYPNEAGTDKINMYPWIITTAIILFFLGTRNIKTNKI